MVVNPVLGGREALEPMGPECSAKWWRIPLLTVASGINHHLAGTLWYIPPPLESGINHHLAKAPKT